MRIAVDAMGGDYGAKVPLLATLDALERYPNLRITMVGKEELLSKFLSKIRCKRKLLSRLDIKHAPEVVTMTDSPATAIRGKKHSSMRYAIDMVKAKEADAAVSSGNTGALMSTAHFVLRTLPGIDRSAIISALPTFTNRCRVIDLGANVDSLPEHLLQFAIMGSVLTQAVDNVISPRVGLLNIGVEEFKGNDQVKRTAELLNRCDHINYIGYVEGDDIFKDTVDVVVADGFVGNVALKSSEGTARLLSYFMKEAFQKNLYTKIMGMLVRPALKQFKHKTDPARYNGATFLGLQGIVVKSHGSADKTGFENAIIEAIHEVERDVPSLIGERMQALIGKEISHDA